MSERPPRVLGALQLLSQLEGKAKRVIDLGCGDGHVTCRLKEMLRADEVYGLDIDREKLFAAKERGIKTHRLDLNQDKLPFQEGYFDLACSLEVVEHLFNPDNMLNEVHRVLSRGGWLLISTPNLASWANRISLLLGYQPYNVEVSTEIVAGVPYARGVFRRPAGHVRAFTFRALKQLLEHHGFQVVTVAGYPGVNPKNGAMRLMDRLFSRRHSLARRLVALAAKS